MEHKETENSGLEIDKTIIETTGKIEAFYEQNKKNINIALIAIIAVVGGYFAFKIWYLEPKEKEAQTAVFNAQIWFEKDSFDLALNGQGEKLGFLAIIDEFGMTKTANLAHYYAGISYLRKGDFANAIAAALSGLGSTASIANKVHKALKTVGLSMNEYLNSNYE